MKINFEEYLKLRNKGKKCYIVKKEHVLVSFVCNDCGIEVNIGYKFLVRRGRYSNEPICISCCGKRTPKVSFKDAEFRKNPEYNKKLSEGVKKNRKENPETLIIISNKLKEIWNTEERKEIQRVRSLKLWKDAEYRQHNISGSHKNLKLEYKGLKCDSVAEYAFLKFIENKCDKIERCDFIIPYVYDNKERNYLPDFKITIKDKIIIYEIKGIHKSRLEKNNNNFKKGFLNKDFIDAKFNALKEFCKKVNWECRMLLLDNKEYNNIYRQVLKELNYENNKKRNNII